MALCNVRYNAAGVEESSHRAGASAEKWKGGQG
jgi:hypothetical protein